MENVAEQTEEEDDHADLDAVEAAGPVVGCEGPVAGEVPADAGRVEELECDGEEPDEGVDGGHGGLKDERVEDRAVEVV